MINQTEFHKEEERMNQFANLTKEQFDSLVQAEVEKHLSSKEEAEARKEAEQALTEAREIFESLKASIEAKDAKIKEYEDVLANLDLDPTAAEVAANEKVLAFEAKIEELTRRAEVAEAALETLAREEIAANRMAELEEEGIALEGEAAETQYSKVRVMSDEDFASYKSELTALRSKYAPTSEEVEEIDPEAIELSSDELSEIAKSLGCDPSDAKCVSLVSEVAAKMAEVSKSRKMKKLPPFMVKIMEKKEKEKSEEVVEETPVTEETPAKEAASTKLSLGEAIARSVNQNIQAPASLKEEIAQAWVDRYAEKRGEKKSQ